MGFWSITFSPPAWWEHLGSPGRNLSFGAAAGFASSQAAGPNSEAIGKRKAKVLKNGQTSSLILSCWRRQPVLAFFLIACTVSWGSWLAATLLAPVSASALPALLRALTGFGPLLAAVVMVVFSQTAAQRRDFWQRLIDTRRIDGRSLAVIVLAFPMLHVAAILLGVLSGGDWAAFQVLGQLLGQPWFIPLFLLDMFINGPLSQEIGWRGFALNGLVHRMRPLAAALVLGALWAVWQLPLLFIDGRRLTVDHLLRPSPWLFLMAGVLSSILFTWLFLRTRRSTMAAMAFRFMQNLAWAVFPLSTLSRFYQVLLLLVIAAWISRGPGFMVEIEEDDQAG